MNAKDAINIIYNLAPKKEKTCDTVIYGNPDKEVTKLAVTCIATAKVIREASTWGADLILTHEPTFFDNFDVLNNNDNDYVVEIKKKMLSESDITVARFHDGMHFSNPDIIATGEIAYIGLKGEYVQGDNPAINRFILDEEATASEIASQISVNLGISNIRIVGEVNKKCKNISLCFGAPGENVFKEIKRKETQIAICGEAWEWQWCEYVRDAAEVGLNKSMIVLGHMVSERDGMKFLSKQLSGLLPDITIKYFDCGDVYK